MSHQLSDKGILVLLIEIIIQPLTFMRLQGQNLYAKLVT